jgi:hypothetical protein
MRSWEHIQSQVRAKIRSITQKALTPKSPVPPEIDQILATFLRRHHYKIEQWWNPESKGRIVSYLGNWVASIEYRGLTVVLTSEAAPPPPNIEIKISLYDPESFPKILAALQEMWEANPESRKRIRNAAVFVLDTIYSTSFLKIPTAIWVVVIAFSLVYSVRWLLCRFVW